MCIDKTSLSIDKTCSKGIISLTQSHVGNVVAASFHALLPKIRLPAVLTLLIPLASNIVWSDCRPVTSGSSSLVCLAALRRLPFLPPVPKSPLAAPLVFKPFWAFTLGSCNPDCVPAPCVVNALTASSEGSPACEPSPAVEPLPGSWLLACVSEALGLDPWGV